MFQQFNICIFSLYSAHSTYSVCILLINRVLLAFKKIHWYWNVDVITTTSYEKNRGLT